MYPSQAAQATLKSLELSQQLRKNLVNLQIKKSKEVSDIRQGEFDRCWIWKIKNLLDVQQTEDEYTKVHLYIIYLFIYSKDN